VTDPLTSRTWAPPTSVEPVPGGRSQTPPAGPGTIVAGRYELRAAIGQGGMGNVWRATDTVLGRPVAVKEVTPPPNVSADERDAMYERLLREARACAALSHPSVVQVYDVVTDAGRPWVVMELLDARSLAEMVLSDGPLAPRAVAKIGVAILGALEVAHAAGVLHRDVKPANVLVCSDGRCVLTDFGVARTASDANLTTPGMVLGSPHFISPERALGASFGPPSDLFSLGVTLYTAVEGNAPFDRGDAISTMHAIVEDEPPAPQRAGPLAPVLYGLLEKNPEHRWDAATARDRLRDLLAGPLASRTPMFPTDPQAVIPPQWTPPPPTVAPSSGRIGGRAMLGPGDDPFAQTSDPFRHDPDTFRDHPDAFRTSADPYRSVPDAYREVPDPYADAPRSPAAWSGGHALPSRTAPAAPSHPAPPASAAAPASSAAAAAGRLRETVRAAPPRLRLAAGAGLAVVVLIGVVWAVSSLGGDPEGAPVGQQPTPAPTASAPADQPLIPIQRFADRGIEVNLPEGWQETASTEIRVDFADPDDSGARLRLLQEPSGADAMRFIEIIEPGLSCPDPYQRVGLTETELAGLPAALLEYTCGTGEEARHSLWITTVRDQTAYSFYLSVPDDQFEERRVIFEEMVRSFRFVD
jgi:eukaryotic-like serine/threonine-protein kinase